MSAKLMMKIASERDGGLESLTQESRYVRRSNLVEVRCVETIAASKSRSRADMNMNRGSDAPRTSSFAGPSFLIQEERGIP